MSLKLDIKKQRNLNRILFLLITTIVSVFVIYNAMKKRSFVCPISFYLVSKVNNQKGTLLMYEGIEKYKIWFISTAKKVNFSETFYKEIIIGNERLNYMLTNRIVSYNDDKFNDDKLGFFYFYIDKDFSKYLLLSLQIQDGENNEHELKEFKQILQQIVDNKIIVLAEYNKQEGWFNYKETMDEKNKLK